MGRLIRGSGAVFLVLATSLVTAAQEAPSWSSVWSRVDALRSGETENTEAARMTEELAALARAHADEPRGRLLAAQLDRLAGRPPAQSALRELARVPVDTLEGRELWLLAEVLEPGPARVRAVLRALETTESPSRDDYVLAWNVATDEARALRLAEGAAPIQEILHRRYEAAWSAIDLASTRTRLGDAAGADAVLAEAIAREEAANRPTANLWSQRGITALGFGDEARARDYFGRALARGSENASLALGRLDLDAGRLGAARMEFRASILSDQPAAWALRGWGLTLLPQPRAAERSEPSRDDER